MKMIMIDGRPYPARDDSEIGTIGPTVVKVNLERTPTMIDRSEFRFASWRAPSSWQGRRTKKKFHGKKWDVPWTHIRVQDLYR